MAQSSTRDGNSTGPSLHLDDIGDDSANAGGDTLAHGGMIPGGMAVRRNLHPQLLDERHPGGWALARLRLCSLCWVPDYPSALSTLRPCLLRQAIYGVRECADVDRGIDRLCCPKA